MRLSRSRRFPVLVALCLPLLVTACGSTAQSAAKQRTFTNPVYRQDFPDPYVLHAGSTYYAFATNGNSENVQEIHSHDLVHWTGATDAMPLSPRWVQSDIWAPEVFRRADGKYVLYYAARNVDLNTHCLGAAVAGKPGGPYIDRAKKPIFCKPSEGGDIDPDVFKDSNGSVYLVWKNDGNSIGLPTYLYSQKLTRDGLKLTGKRVALTYNRQPWEGSVVEAPSMWKHAEKYYLFYSGNAYNSFSYATGYATCKSPLGPCTDAPQPILTSKCKAAGPGHQTLIVDGKGQTWLVYAAWKSGAVDDATVGRQLWMDRLDWKGGKPVVHGPTCTAQTAPAP